MVYWFKSQGLFLDRNKALTEDKKTGVESLLTGTESNKTGMKPMQTGTEWH